MGSLLDDVPAAGGLLITLIEKYHPSIRLGQQPHNHHNHHIE